MENNCCFGLHDTRFLGAWIASIVLSPLGQQQYEHKYLAEHSNPSFRSLAALSLALRGNL